jgi:hypothetical protein
MSARLSRHSVASLVISTLNKKNDVRLPDQPAGQRGGLQIIGGNDATLPSMALQL